MQNLWLLKFWAKIKLYKYPISLVLTTLIICYTNYTPGTWVSGWDNLHPEINFGIYWQRILNSVWQEHQGLGAVATQAHASEIPRIMILQFLSIFLPTHFLRWAYMFLMLIIGPLGIYFLCRELFHRDFKKDKYAFIGGLYYLLNWGTMQHFYVFLEMFVTLYGYIGWLFLFPFQYLKTGRMRYYALFSLITFFAMPMAHTPTLWFVYIMMFGLFIVSYVALNGDKIRVIKRSLLLMIGVFAINAFWLFPTVYFAISHAEDVANAKITRLVSEEAILNNQEYANIESISILKGYLFNWQVFRDGDFSPIFLNFYKYLTLNPHVIYLGYAIYAIVLVGIIFTLIFRSRNFSLFLLIFISSTFFLLMDSPPFGFIFTFMLDRLPLLKEAIRFPFTKFSITLMFAYAVFMAFGSSIIEKLFVFLKFGKISSKLPFLTASILIIIFSYPIISGNLIADVERVNYPTQYNEAFSYLNEKENIRIATLPAHFLFGWLYFDWKDNGRVDADYQGAGFSWFFSKNPILEREFDRWYTTNEDFYNEYQYALYSENPELFKYVLNKYQINYIVHDKSIVSPFAQKAIFSEGIQNILSDNVNIKLDRQFGTIDVYKVDLINQTADFIYSPKQYTEINGKYALSNIDPVVNNAELARDYIYKEHSGKYLPFADDDVLANSYSDPSQKSYSITIPRGNSGTFTIRSSASSTKDGFPASVDFSGSTLNVSYLYPQILDNNNEVIFSKSYSQSISFDDSSQILINNIHIGSTGFGDNLLLKQKNDVVVFPEEPAEITYIGERIYSAQLTDCFGGTGGYGKDFGAYPDSVTLRVFDKNACLDFDKVFYNPEPSVYQIVFDYKSTLAAKPLYCLYEDGVGGCLNSKYKNAPIKTLKYNEYVDYVYVKDPKKLRLSLIIETEDKKTEQSVDYKRIYINRFSVVSTTTFDVDDSAHLGGDTLQIDGAKFPVKVQLPEYGSLSRNYTQDYVYFNPISQNCDNINEKSFSREQEIDPQTNNSAFIYTAQDAISCDSVDTRVINPSANYVIGFNTLHYQGKGLDICVLSQNFEKCLFQDRLKGGIENFILPSYPGAGDITIGIGNQSIGNIVTKNAINSISVDYIPYNWLKSFIIEKDSGNIDNAIIVTNTNKKSSYFYDVSVDENSIDSKSGLIILNQSFEKGWQLYEANECIFNIKAPVFCKKANAEHVLAKNWANGWIIPSEDKEYLMIFIPQYLQYIGYFIFIVFVGDLMYTRFRDLKHLAKRMLNR